jgi:hypothetical protein
MVPRLLVESARFDIGIQMIWIFRRGITRMRADCTVLEVRHGVRWSGALLPAPGGRNMEVQLLGCAMFIETGKGNDAMSMSEKMIEPQGARPIKR